MKRTSMVCALTLVIAGCGGGSDNDEPALTIEELSARVAEHFPQATKDVTTSAGFSPEETVSCSFFGDLQDDGSDKYTCLIVADSYPGPTGTPTVSSNEPRVHLLEAITPSTLAELLTQLYALVAYSAFQPLVITTLGGIDFGIHPLTEVYTPYGQLCVEPGLVGAEAQLLVTTSYVDSVGTHYLDVALTNDGTGCFTLPDLRTYPIGAYSVIDMTVNGANGLTVFEGIVGSFQVTATNELPSGTLTRTGSYKEIGGEIRDINTTITYECLMEDPEEGLLDSTLERRFDGGEWLTEAAFTVDISSAGSQLLETRCAASDSFGAVGYSATDTVGIHQNTGPVIANPEDFAYLAEKLEAEVNCDVFFKTLECSVDPETDSVFSSQTYEGWVTFEAVGEYTLELSCLDEYGSGEVAIQTIVVIPEGSGDAFIRRMDQICYWTPD